MTILPIGVRIHDETECSGTCPFHNPSAHKMRDWPMTVRTDRNALVERLCEHGVGHPDPDSTRYLTALWPGGGFGIHGCDGCCAEAER